MPRKSSGRTGRNTSPQSSTRSTRSRNSRSKTSSNHRSSQHGSSHGNVLSISRGRRSATRGQSSRSSRSAQSHPLTDHEEIRQWAEERNARPACVRGTGGGEDVGMIRLDFPGYSGEKSLQEIDWDEWFQKFDDSGLALLVQEQTAQGQKSNFNKLVKRETAEKKQSSQGHGKGQRKKAA